MLSKIVGGYTIRSCLLRNRFKNLHLSIMVKPTTFLNGVGDLMSHRLVLVAHDVAYGIVISEL